MNCGEVRVTFTDGCELTVNGDQSGGVLYRKAGKEVKLKQGEKVPPDLKPKLAHIPTILRALMPQRTHLR